MGILLHIVVITGSKFNSLPFMKKLYALGAAVLIINASCIFKATAQTITNFSPLSGPSGTAVTITGTGYNTTASLNVVYFGPVQATVTAASATSLTVTAPITAGYNNISVTNLTTNLTAYSAKPYNLEFPVTGEQSFADGYELSTSFLPGKMIAGDLDNDGKTDLVAINSTSHSLAIFRNLTTVGFTFGASIDVAIGVSSILQVLIDLDGDGKKDIVTASQGSNVVSIFRNTSVPGTISFASKVDLSATSVTSVAAGDLNRDGKPDLVSAGSSILSSFKNTSTPGNLSFVKTTLALTNINSVAVGDIDGDNLPDVAATTLLGPATTLSLFRNISTADILFASKVDLTAGSSAGRIILADLDGDGKLDAVTQGSSFSIFRNTSSIGSISMAAKVDQMLGVSSEVVAGDLDGDGKPDLAVSLLNTGVDLTNSVAVLRNTSVPGTLSFLPRVEYPVGLNRVTSGVVMADLNGDGRPDLSVTQGSVNKVILLRNISLVEPPPSPSITSFDPAAAAPGATVTITGSNFNLNAASNKVTFGPVAAQVTAASATSLTVTVPVGAAYGPIEVLNTSTNLKGTSTSRFSPTFAPLKAVSVFTDLETKVDYIAGSLTTGLLVSDIDGDGKSDIAVPNQTSANVSVFRNNASIGSFSSSSFNPKVDFAAAGGPVYITGGDLDNDGKAEMITANGTGQSLSIFRNTSSSGSITSSSFAAKADITTGGNTTVVAVSDINLDGKPELLYLNSGVSSLFVAKNNSIPGTLNTSSFATAVSFTTGTTPSSIAVGDLNGDGKPEVVVTNTASNSISIFNNTSTRASLKSASLGGAVTLAVGNAPSTVVIGDLNGDGKPEIIVGNRNDGTASVFRNIATSGAITTASFAAKKEFRTGGVLQTIAISDMNGDGNPDLLNTTVGSTTILQNITTDPANILFAAFISSPLITSPKTAVAADLDGDFKPDIIVASQTGFSVFKNNPNNKPIAFTSNASAASTNGATLDGSVNPNGETTAVSFEYGLAPDLSDAQSVAATTGGTKAAGSGSTSSSLTLTGLMPGKIYFFRIKAQNASGTIFGLTREFATLLSQTPLAAPVVSYGDSAKEFKTGSAIIPLQPVSTGGEIPPAVYLSTTTLAGSTTFGYADGIGSQARFDAVTHVVADGLGNLYISDQLNYRIRKLVLATNEVSTLAGSGTPGFADGTGTAASFNLPAGLALDGAGNLFVADLSNHRIRKIVLATGVVTTLAGSTFGFVNGTGAAAKFNSPWGIAYDGAGYLYVADQSNGVMRRVNIATQVVSTISGSMNNPTGIALDNGMAYVLDQINKTVRKIDVASQLSSILATSIQTQFNDPSDVVTDGAGNLYVADSENHVIKKVSIATGTTTILAGSVTSGSEDGVGTTAKFKSPVGVSYDRSNLYVADGNNTIRKISLSGYTITPALPAGLLFDNNTGIISGTPTVVSASKSYTITAYNAAGMSMTNIDLSTVLPPVSAIPQETPVFSQASGPVAFGSAISITSAGADTILYTINGADPAIAGIRYIAPVTVNAALTLRAIAKKAGRLNSVVATAAYTQAVSSGLTALSISNNPSGFSFNPIQFNYTITFLSPLTSFTVTPSGEGAITIDGVALGSGTASAPIALVQGIEKSLEISISQPGRSARIYTVKATLPLPQESPVFSQASGPVAFGSAISITSAGADTILYTINGADPAIAGIRYTAPVTVNAALTLRAIAKKAGRLNSAVVSATYTQAASVGLTALNVSNNPGSYTFNPNQLDYGLSFPNSTADFTVTAFGQGTNTIDGLALTSGTPSAVIPLVAGMEKTIKINFTEVGKTTRTYTLKVTRAKAGQLVTDNNGQVTLSTGNTQVLITSPTQSITVVVSVGTASPSIDYSALIVGGTGIIPQTTVQSTVANMSIPASVTVTSSNPSWNGVLAVPTVTTYVLPPNTGEITTYGLTIEVGSPDVSLSFSRGIRLLLPGQAGKRAGFVRGGVFTEITLNGLTDTQAEADQLAANSAYKINVGPDLVIWTKGFSKFLTFTRSTDPDIALLAFDKEAMSEDLLKGQNIDLASITQSMLSPLPSTGPNGSTIIWTSTDAAVVSPSGVVKRPVFGTGNSTVILTATFKKGLITDTRTYRVIVQEAPNTAPAMAAIASGSICATTVPQILNLTGINAGAEANQQLSLSVSSNNPTLFSSLSVSQPINGVAALSYTLAAGRSGSATVTVNLRDDGGTAIGGADTFVRTFIIQVNQLPVVQVMSSGGISISKGHTSILSASGGTAYSWAAAAGIISGQNTSTLTVRPAVTTTYTVSVTNASGCVTTQSITVVVRDDYQALDAMNIMTPNGDGVNDFLVIKNLDMYPNNMLRVFDKAGRQIYVEQNYTNKWAGTLNGSTLAEGTYFYFLDFANGKGQVKGFVSIAH